MENLKMVEEMDQDWKFLNKISIILVSLMMICFMDMASIFGIKINIFQACGKMEKKYLAVYMAPNYITAASFLPTVQEK